MHTHPVLVVDDDPVVRTLILALLERKGHAAEGAIDGEDAIARLRRHPYDALVLDLMLPGRNGFDVLQFLRAERPATLQRTIVVTAASETTLRHFDETSVHALIRKPFDIDDLTHAVDDCCAIRTETPVPSDGESAPSSAPASPH